MQPPSNNHLPAVTAHPTCCFCGLFLVPEVTLLNMRAQRNPQLGTVSVQGPPGSLRNLVCLSCFIHTLCDPALRDAGVIPTTGSVSDVKRAVAAFIQQAHETPASPTPQTEAVAA